MPTAPAAEPTLTVGVDAVRAERLREVVAGDDDRRRRVFTDRELEHCQGKRREYEHLAARFAAKKAVLKAFDAAHAAGKLVSITLSDSFCVDRYRDEFRSLVRDKIDILFGNEAELTSLYQVDSFDKALEAARKEAKIAALTRSEKGSVVIKGSETYEVPAAPVSKVVDTTGAGDLYASGFLYGFTRSKPLAECARLGGIAAAEIISHVGARPETPLKDLI